LSTIAFPPLSERWRSRLLTVGPAMGWLCLALALVSTVLFPWSLGTIVLALLATIGLAFDRRFGPLPAALLVTLALPYDRAANGFLPRFADIPIRAQDVAVLAGALMSLPALRRLPRQPVAIAVGAFLVVGLIALAIGVFLDNAMRDILRDARWWALYGFALLALATRVPRPAVVRAVLWGTTIFAALVITIAVLPAFADALKLRSLEFDRGLLRMQFGNSTMLLATLAAATVAATLRPTRGRIGWLLLIVVAIVITLTRTFIVVSIIVGALALVLALRSEPRRSTWLRRAAAPVLTAVVGCVLAVGLATFAISVTGFTVRLDHLIGGPAGASTPGSAEDPLERLLLQGSVSGLESLGGGRFVTYGRALDVIERNPVAGSGLGALVVAEYSFGGEPFDTPGKLPNVDNAWLTVGMKAGVLGILAFGALIGSAIVTAARGPRRYRVWLLPFWVGVLILTMTQSFATTGYGPFVLGLLAVVPILPYASSNRSRARDQA
jgi:hypothetical protein